MYKVHLCVPGAVLGLTCDDEMKCMDNVRLCLIDDGKVVGRFVISSGRRGTMRGVLQCHPA